MAEKLGVGIIGVDPGRSWGATAHIPALGKLSDRFEITGMFLVQGNLRLDVALSLLNNRIYRNKRNTIGKNKQAYN